MAVKPTDNDVPDREAKRQLKRFRAQVEEEAIEHQMAYLNITPMMDMMTILLVFLLKQFSVQASAASMSEGLQLPMSSVESQRPLAVNVTITQSAILVEGDGVTTVRAGAVDPSVKRDGANGYYITPLVDVLNKHANRLKKIAAMGGSQFDGTATILVDKNTPYRLLTEVLYSAGQAEFKNYHLVVIKRGQ
ncbi:MAG: Adventurous gliding motility protein [Myxococcales bacterium]|nr:Adventurous gliding motility protein [Myxococcales bacterium]